MTSHSEILDVAVASDLAPEFQRLGFVGSRGRRWRRNALEVRVLSDSKSADPFRGSAFTLEFEKSDDHRFEHKLAGRVRLEQLLDRDQRDQFLELRNLVASRAQLPSEAILSTIPESVREEYLKAFLPAGRFETRMWMRYWSADDVNTWCQFVRGVLPDLVSRASQIDAHSLLLGMSLEW